MKEQIHQSDMKVALKIAIGLRLEIKVLESDLKEYESILKYHNILFKTCVRLNALKDSNDAFYLDLVIEHYQWNREKYIRIMEENGVPYKQKAKVIILPKSHIPVSNQGKSFIELKLIEFFKELFLDTGLHQILMTQKVILKEVFDLDYNTDRHLLNLLKTDLGLEQSKLQKYAYPHYQEGELCGIIDRGRPYIFLRQKFIDGTEGKLRNLS